MILYGDFVSFEITVKLLLVPLPCNGTLIIGEETPPKFSYYTFSSCLSLPVEYDSIKDVVMNELIYKPAGSTSLLDAIGDIMKKHELEE